MLIVQNDTIVHHGEVCSIKAALQFENRRIEVRN